MDKNLSATFADTFQHDQQECLGVLVVNLGTPNAPTRKEVRRYLKEFLWDRRVVAIPRALWWFVLHLVILNRRPQRSAKAYARVWTAQGSPLLVISTQQREALEACLSQRQGKGIKVTLAMRYGHPSIAEGLAQLQQAGARKILVFPLYPQYSSTTTAAVFDAVAAALQTWRWLPELRFVNHYHDHPAYISALAERVRAFWQEHGTPEILLMSFHSLPQALLQSGDPYFCECQKTGRLLAKALDLSASQWQLSFQSRLGVAAWLQPYTDQALQKLATEGVKSVQVVCPGFSADCLETLDEIALEDREVFIQAGGESYHLIPCLNKDAAHITALADIVEQHTQGWLPTPLAETGEACVQRAKALGAKQ